MRIFIMKYKKNKTIKAVVEKTLTEALKRARWMEKNTLFINAYTIKELLVNPDIWKQPKYQVDHKVNRVK